MIDQPSQRAAEGHDESDRQAHAKGHVDPPGHAQVRTDAQKLRQNEVVDDDNGDKTHDQGGKDRIHFVTS